jgi:hypothetical protein
VPRATGSAAQRGLRERARAAVVAAGSGTCAARIAPGAENTTRDEQTIRQRSTAIRAVSKPACAVTLKPRGRAQVSAGAARRQRAAPETAHVNAVVARVGCD